jgi:hypothetical protein
MLLGVGGSPGRLPCPNNEAGCPRKAAMGGWVPITAANWSALIRCSDAIMIAAALFWVGGCVEKERLATFRPPARLRTRRSGNEQRFSFPHHVFEDFALSLSLRLSIKPINLWTRIGDCKFFYIITVVLILLYCSLLSHAYINTGHNTLSSTLRSK